MSAEAHLMSMAHSPLKNYIVPGLTSWLLGNPGSGQKGLVRLFTCSRQQMEHVTPHSHRFDFACQVLEGEVRNRIWTSNTLEVGDPYSAFELRYLWEPGQYVKEPLGGSSYYNTSTSTYKPGDWYEMRHDEIHDIQFSKDSMVLFFEGRPITDRTLILEPVVDGKVIPTFKVEPWMFQRGST